VSGGNGSRCLNPKALELVCYWLQNGGGAENRKGTRKRGRGGGNGGARRKRKVRQTQVIGSNTKKGRTGQG